MSIPRKAVFRTLVYADIFDYPLKLEEIGKWTIKVKSQKSKVKKDKYSYTKGFEL